MTAAHSPAWLVEAARVLMTAIDIDPCSCETAQETVRARRIYMCEADGLAQRWDGRVFINPPFSGGVRRWIEKLGSEMKEGRVEQAVVVLPADMLSAVTCKWFGTPCGVLFIPNERIRFHDPGRQRDRTEIRDRGVLSWPQRTSVYSGLRREGRHPAARDVARTAKPPRRKPDWIIRRRFRKVGCGAKEH